MSGMRSESEKKRLGRKARQTGRQEEEHDRLAEYLISR